MHSLWAEQATLLLLQPLHQELPRHRTCRHTYGIPACALGVSINWVAVPSNMWALAKDVSGGSVEVTLAASGRKAGTNKSVSGPACACSILHLVLHIGCYDLVDLIVLLTSATYTSKPCLIWLPQSYMLLLLALKHRVILLQM